MPFLFEKLAVYQKVLAFADRIATVTDSFPTNSRHLADQLRRAAVSISANIAEGNGRWHVGDRRHFIYIARGSACECVPLMDLCGRRGLIGDDQRQDLLRCVDELARMLTSLAGGHRRRPSAGGETEATGNGE
jgi:four helix bundle protein